MVGAALMFLRSQLALQAHFCIDLWPSEPSFLNDPTVFLMVFTYFRASLWDHFLSDFWAPKSSKNKQKIRQIRIKNRPESDIKKTSDVWSFCCRKWPPKWTPKSTKNRPKYCTEIDPAHFLTQLGHLGAIFDNLSPILGYLGASKADFWASGWPFWTLWGPILLSLR